MDQLTMVANPARSQLHRGKYVSLCPRSRLRIWPRDTGLVVPSRVRLLVIHTRMLNLVLQYVRIVSIKSARGQLNTENEYFPVPVRARELRETASGRLVPRQSAHSPYSQAKSGATVCYVRSSRIAECGSTG